VFISGDDKAVAEARALIPGIYGAQVKVGLAPQLALHLAPEDARELIRSVAQQAAEHIAEIPPYLIPGPPYEHEIKVWGQTDPSAYIARGYRQVDARTFILRAERLEELMI